VADITASVRQLWDFMWPASVLVAALSLSAYAAANDTLNLLFRKCGAAVSAQNVRSVEIFLKRLSLKHLIPVVSGFLILFVLFATRNVVLAVGESLPPNIASEPECIFATDLTDAEIACLKAKFGQRLSLSAMLRVAVARGELKSARTASGELWRDSAAQFAALFDVAKFLSLWVVAWSIVERIRRKRSRRELMVVIVVLFVCVACSFVALGGYVNAKHQQFLDEAVVLRSLISPQLKPCQLSVTDQQLYSSLREERWWWFEAGSWETFEWFVHHGARGAG
jgi:hypothetical protein